MIEISLEKIVNSGNTKLMICSWHLCNNELSGRQTKYCSRQCNSKAHVTKYRRQIKEKAIAYKGGSCYFCGYNKTHRALHFHHLHDKSFGIASEGQSRPWSTVVLELDKCILVCANCHAEIHDGIIYMSILSETGNGTCRDYNQST